MDINNGVNNTPMDSLSAKGVPTNTNLRGPFSLTGESAGVDCRDVEADVALPIFGEASR